MTSDDQDERYMQRALDLARGQLGLVWPNPAVGCVLVRDGIVVGEGATQKGGRPHAEAVALADAGREAAGATAYVTLEPCSHTGQTPPCADALIKAGISRCVVALADPDERVDGTGVEQLQAAGISVDLGLLHEAAAEINEGFFHRIEKGVPKTYEISRFDTKTLSIFDAILLSVRTYLESPSDWEEANLLLLAVATSSDRDYVTERLALCDPSAWIIAGRANDLLLGHFARVVEAGALNKKKLDSSVVLRRLGEAGLTRVGVVQVLSQKTVRTA